jgi:hypothetical protein
MRGASVREIGGRYDIELAVLEELNGWTLNDVWGAPADFVQEVLVRRAARSHWQREARKLRDSMAQQRREVSGY